MLQSLLRTLTEEKVFILRSDAHALPFPLHGVIRVVDASGNTLGLVIDKATLDELEEDFEAQEPEFLASLEKSRRSGRVSSKEVKRKAGLL